MTRKWLLYLTALMAFLWLAGCGVKQEGKNDAPAGNPDELKDSTRFDPAPDTSKIHEPAPGEKSKETAPHEGGQSDSGGGSA